MTRLLYRFSISIFILALGTNYLNAADNIPGRWSAEKANQWYASQPWPVGCNYIPSTAVNQIETWQAESFDPETIDRELGWAAGIGMNTVRVYLHDLAWQADPDGVKEFGERACMAGGLGGRFAAVDLMPLMLAHAGRLDKYGACLIWVDSAVAGVQPAGPVVYWC